MIIYPIYEIFVSVQGEGANTGRAAVFVRLAGCNVGCEWCDSEGAQSTKAAEWLTANEIISNFKFQSRGVMLMPCSKSQAQGSASHLPVIITGGEPTMYDLTELTDALHEAGHDVWLETSGTEPLRGTFDWICLSPKQHRMPLTENWERADEIKIVIGTEKDIEFVYEFSTFNFQLSTFNLYLQPEWNNRETALPLIIDFITSNPEWRLSLQTHKYININ